MNFTGLAGQAWATAASGTSVASASAAVVARSSERIMDSPFSLSVGCDVVLAHDLTPALHLSLEPLRESLGRAEDKVYAERLGVKLAHVRQLERLDELGVELVDDRPGHARGTEDRPPCERGKTWQALLGERGHVGKRTRASVARNRDG